MRRRPPPKRVRPSFLYSPWLYVGLGALTLILYGWPLMHTLTRGAPQAAPAQVETGIPPSILTQELDLATVTPIVQRKPMLGWLLMWWTILILGFSVAGIWFMVQAVWQGKLANIFRYRPRLRRCWSLREAGRIVVVLAVVVGLLPFAFLSLISWGWSDLADPNLRTLVSTIIFDGMVVLVVWAFAMVKVPSPAVVLGMTAGRRTHPFGTALIGYVALFPWVGGLLWLIARTCQRLGIEPPIEPIHQLLFLDTRTWVLALTVFLACVAGPVVEELFFRGILFAAVRRHTSRVVAMLVSGSLFAAMHSNVLGFLPILILGCLLADLYERTGSLFAPMMVHVLHNTLLIGLGLTMKAILLEVG